MNKIISITTDNPALYGFLKSNLPDGVQIISDSPYEGRGIDIVIATDIKIVIDLAVIAKYAFAVWLIKYARTLKGKHKININRQQIPVDDPEAVDLIAREIEDE